MVGLMVFIAIGGDAWVIKGLAETYDVVGLLQYPSLGALVGGANTAFVGVFVSALEIAGPVLIALILTDAAFGMVTRVSRSSTPSRSAVPGQGRPRPAARRRLDALRRRLARGPAAGRRRHSLETLQSARG